MHDRHAKLRGRKRGTHRRVHVAGYDNRIGPQLDEQIFDAHQHGRGLSRVGSRSDAEIEVWHRHLEMLDEAPGQCTIVVLSRVDNLYIALAHPPQRMNHWRDFDKVGSGPNHAQDGIRHTAEERCCGRRSFEA